MQTLPHKLLKYLLASILWLALIAPLILYALTFGAELSNSHLRWAEFGSAMSGIYSPILAIFTIVLLIAQLRMQARFNTHEFDQAYIAQARADLDFYLSRLHEALSEHLSTGNTVREVLHHQFQPVDKAVLSGQRILEIAVLVDKENPRILSLWSAIYPILIGLQAGRTSSYKLNMQSSIQKLIAIASFETCVALDNFHYTRSEGRLKYEYQFSPLIRTH